MVYVQYLARVTLLLKLGIRAILVPETPISLTKLLLAMKYQYYFYDSNMLQ